MDNSQHAWARGELDKVYPDPDNKVRQAVTALLSVWTRVDLPMSGEERADAVTTFYNLAQMRPLTKPEPEGPKRIWGSASQYGINAQYARVKPDAVHKDDLWKFDDRVGEIVGLRRGVMTIVFLDSRAGAPPGHQASIHNFEVDISHLIQES